MRADDNPILMHSFRLELEVIGYCELLQDQKKWVMANQLLRAGMSIGANIREAQNAESKADFIHKFKIAAKEADETGYWLELRQASPHYPDSDHLPLNLDVIKRIVNKIIITSKAKNA